MPLISALRRQRQVDFWVQAQPSLQSEFQDSQGYTEKPCLEKNKAKTNLYICMQLWLRLEYTDWFLVLYTHLAHYVVVNAPDCSCPYLTSAEMISICHNTCHKWYFFLFVFQDRVSLYSPGCPGTHSVDQAGLELRNPPASASQVLGLKACATTPSTNDTFNWLLNFIILRQGLTL